jgi:hypothetical protein
MRAIAACCLSSIIFAAGCASPGTVGPQIQETSVEAERDYQETLAVQLLFDEEAKIDALSRRILAANEAFCERKGVWLGFGAHSELDFSRQLRPVARERFGHDRSLRVTWISPDSPAAAAGLQVGDIITAIDGDEIRARVGAWTEERLDIESVGPLTPVSLTIERNGAPSTIMVSAPRTCGYPVFVTNDEAINAYADGRAIYVNRGLIRFTRSDHELAMVIAHELAHNSMGHIQAQRTNAAVGAVGGLLIAFAAGGVNTGGAFSDSGADIGAMRFSQDFENEADYVAMYYLARSDHELDGVEEFWRRTAAENPRSVVISGTHPTTPERFVRIQAARDEIRAKVAAGEDLSPNMREGRESPIADGE